MKSPKSGEVWVIAFSSHPEEEYVVSLDERAGTWDLSFLGDDERSNVRPDEILFIREIPLRSPQP